MPSLWKLFYKRPSLLNVYTVKKPRPVDTGRKLNVHKMFRRRPGGFLDVLYTFNLRPVSTGRCRMAFYLTNMGIYCTSTKISQ